MVSEKNHSKWRVIRPMIGTAYFHQAVGQSLLKSIGKGISPPTIRLFQCKPATVSISLKQKIGDVVDVEACKRLGISITRRSSGGGAVFLNEGTCFTFSVVAPTSILGRNIKTNYLTVFDRIIDGLEKLDIKATFKPPNDLIVDGKKIAGGTQILTKDAVMVAGTVLYNPDFSIMTKVLKLDGKKLTSIKEYSDQNLDKVLDIMTEALTRRIEFEFGDLTAEEAKQINNFEQSYEKEEWIFKN